MVLYCGEEINMTPEEKARQLIDARLEQAGWVIQDLRKANGTLH